MSPGHCQCQPDQNTVLQSKSDVNWAVTDQLITEKKYITLKCIHWLFYCKTLVLVVAEPPPSGSGLCVSLYECMVLYTANAFTVYFNDVHTKTYNYVTTAPPPQCTAFTSIIQERMLRL